jgi:perosamine synthetase
MNKFIPVNEPLLNGNEKKYLNECIDTGWISSEGPFIKRFEEEFAAKVGRRYAVAVSNGTVAIDAAIISLGIEAGDEVILPTFTIISCIAQIIRIGAIPILVDCDPLTWNMNVSQIEYKISSNTKAIMVVHIYGLPVDVFPVLALAKKYNLKVIEDAAEMHGQTYMNQPCGSFGDISTFSFYPNKHITTGEGGMIVTDDEAMFERCRSLRNLCFQPQKRFVHEELGWNLRMTNLQAALGVAQLERLDEFVARKRAMGQLYFELLSDIQNLIQLPLLKTSFAKNIYWVYGIVLNQNIPFNAEFVMRKMMEFGVGTRPFFYPMHLQPVFVNQGLFKGEQYPVSERIAERGFYLPSGMALTEQEIISTATILKKVLNENI